MAGLYFHIPFCRQACTYCNFHFSTLMLHRSSMVPAMIMEMELRAAEFPFPLETIYFGGGTPSVLPPSEIGKLLEAARRLFHTKGVSEITLEANPEDISTENLQAWNEIGINRLSIGIQSLNDKELKAMNRCHTAAESLAAVDLALAAGIRSINVDLIYGSPWLTDKQWKEHMDWAFSCGADHISAYALTVEPKTALAAQVKTHKVPPPKENRQAAHYHMLSDKAAAEGWDFYEISNLSRPGHRSRHNSAYWSNRPYLGIGPGAHSFVAPQRRWNVSNNALYIKGMENKARVWESETLSEKDLYNEFVMTRLRLSEGLHPDDLADFPSVDLPRVLSSLDEMTGQGFAEIRSGARVLTTEGRLICDHLTTLLMM